jgi:hypothetical protein
MLRSIEFSLSVNATSIQCSIGSVYHIIPVGMLYNVLLCLPLPRTGMTEQARRNQEQRGTYWGGVTENKLLVVTKCLRTLASVQMGAGTKQAILLSEIVHTYSMTNGPWEYELNSVPLDRKRTIPTERPPLAGEVSANFSG